MSEAKPPAPESNADWFTAEQVGIALEWVHWNFVKKHAGAAYQRDTWFMIVRDLLTTQLRSHQPLPAAPVKARQVDDPEPEPHPDCTGKADCMCPPCLEAEVWDLTERHPEVIRLLGYVAKGPGPAPLSQVLIAMDDTPDDEVKELLDESVRLGLLLALEDRYSLVAGGRELLQERAELACEGTD